MQPRISIITICYNAASTITRTLRSVSAQTYPNIQYLIIDGASKDNTLELVRELAPEAEVYSERDKGIYDAMNKGLDRATGDYVWYVNAGDALASPTTVEDLVRTTCTGDSLPDVLYGDTRLIDSEDHDLGLRRLRPPHQLDWRSFRSGMLVCHQAFVAKRSISPHYDLSYRFSADVDWCIRVLKEAKTTAFYPEPIALYLNEGTTTANHRASLIERFHVMRHHYGLVTTVLLHLRFLVDRKR
ncbi:glycosyltransferase family 2 protein [uncultured Porphyromonas sp.]|uniref:glycosyltransferase family 2 protein n=1 Tax=uncultured Porphyromonas sp. TaxID=159274 RepID=UPI002598474D|nr:glycosyltransferase family 2 protein [uncultured Porphyromonas sp.]